MNEFVEYIIDILSKTANIRARKMFGGYGLYANNIFFAIVVENELYFKTDSNLAEEFKLHGSLPFTYSKQNKLVSLNYHSVPPDIIEDNDKLISWFKKTLEVAKTKKSC